MSDTSAIEAVARALDPNAWGTVDYKLPDRANDKARRATSLNKAERAITAYHEHLESKGMVVVPREPSDAMLIEACNKHQVGQPMSETHGEECPRFRGRRHVWGRMIKAWENRNA